MERTLTQFIRALRSAGATVSSAEAIDAARTLALIGYDDRDRMKESLGVVLAKSEDEKQIHDQLFEAFFSRRTGQPQPPQARQQPGDAGDDDGAQSSASQQPGQPGEGGPRGGPGGGEPSGQPGEPPPLPDFMDLAQSEDADQIAVAMERAGVAAGVDEIRFATQTAYYVRRMLEHLGVEKLEAKLLDKLQDRSTEAQSQAKALMDARSALQRHARAYVDQRFELFGKSATENFMNDVVVNREIGQLGLRDMERMKVLVAKMAKRLAVKHSRRRRVRNRGQLDIRRTMRANARHEGVPVELVWRRKRKDKPKIVVICDVSGSVAQYVRFLLLFLYALKDEVADLEAYAFSARLENVAHELETLSFDKAMTRIVDRIGGGGTDYGQALVDLKNQFWTSIDRRTTILVLGDGRSNHTDPRLDIFQEAVDRAKRVVWLSPEPPSRWGSGDSCIPKYQPYCTHLSFCATALDIEQALDEVLMAYD